MGLESHSSAQSNEKRSLSFFCQTIAPIIPLPSGSDSSHLVGKLANSRLLFCNCALKVLTSKSKDNVKETGLRRI